MINDDIQRVRDIKVCPSCGSKWEDDKDIKDILATSYIWEEKAEIVEVASEYNSVSNGKFHRARLLMSGDRDYPDSNFYQCPNCEEMWELGSDRLLSSQERAFAFVFFPADNI